MIYSVQQPSLNLESTKIHSFTTDCIQVLLASLFICAAAKISIPLYFTPVPLTGQTFAVMLIAARLGSKIGFFSLLAYLFYGVAGLPVFAATGPTAGYILGFFLQSYMVGRFFESHQEKNAKNTSIVLASAIIAQLGLGALWLSLFVGFKAAILLGVYPFIIGEALKAVALTTYLKKT